MSDWSAGYVADIGYTYGYYAELNPLRLKLPFLLSGLVMPEVGAACELGFGQGLSVNIHAAASIVQWSGTDFNPEQAGFAQEIAAVSGINARLFDQAFSEFCARTDLPDFDYIGLHGIWSWISDENRHAIVDFLRRKLKTGGVLYISYNTQPGWAAMVPIRELLNQHADVMGSSGQGVVSRIDAALDFAEKMLATYPLYVQGNPQITERIQKMKQQNRNYLAHEYFNKDWHPMSFAKMAAWLAPAKLSFACSAHYTDHVDTVNLTDEQRAFLKNIPDALFREVVRDFMCNTQFRRDYWVKGRRQLSRIEQEEFLRSQRVVLIRTREAINLKVSGARGEAMLDDSVYMPILNLLSQYKPLSLWQIDETLKSQGLEFTQILQAVTILIAKGDMALAQDESIISKTKRFTDKLNLHLMDKCRGSSDIAYLASPVTGGALSVNRFQQLFLLSRSQGKKQPHEWAHFVWQQLQAMNQRLTKEGKAIESAEENLAELLKQATEFGENRLPILKALQIA